MSSIRIMKQALKTIIYVLPMFLLVSCSFQGQTQNHVYLPPSSKIEIGFSPNGAALELILKCIEQSEKSILVAAYSFTSKPISTALLEAYKRGVAVKVIADKKSNAKKYSAVTFLANHGVPVRINGKYQIFHHKFMVIDGLHVETGSFNYSAAAANRNAENVMMLWNVKNVADVYTQQWNLLWEESEAVAPNY